jgi:chromosomal replication initiation ATPase DnaA
MGLLQVHAPYDKEHLKGDEGILGYSDFATQVLVAPQERMEESCRLAAQGYTFDRIVEQVSEHPGLPVEEILSPGKQPVRVKARSVAAHLAVMCLRMDGTTVGRRMGLGQSAIIRAVARKKEVAAESGILFP